MTETREYFFEPINTPDLSSYKPMIDAVAEIIEQYLQNPHNNFSRTIKFIGVSANTAGSVAISTALDVVIGKEEIDRLDVAKTVLSTAAISLISSAIAPALISGGIGAVIAAVGVSVIYNKFSIFDSVLESSLESLSDIFTGNQTVTLALRSADGSLQGGVVYKDGLNDYYLGSDRQKVQQAVVDLVSQGEVEDKLSDGGRDSLTMDVGSTVHVSSASVFDKSEVYRIKDGRFVEQYAVKTGRTLESVLSDTNGTNTIRFNNKHVYVPAVGKEHAKVVVTDDAYFAVKIAATDSIRSMNGTRALIDLMERHGVAYRAIQYVDEAQASDKASNYTNQFAHRSDNAMVVGSNNNNSIVTLNDANNQPLNTYVLAGSGNDTIVDSYNENGGSNDIIDGGENNDYIISSDGNDILMGGGGDDTFLINADRVFVDGGEGQDTADYSDSISSLRVNVSSAEGETYFSISKLSTETPADKLKSLEKLKLSEAADEVILLRQDINSVKLNIDANNRYPGTTNQDSDEDTLSLEAFGAGIKLKNNILYNPKTNIELNPNLKLGNFEIFKYGSGNDVHDVSNSLTHFHTVELGEGDDILLRTPYASEVFTGPGKDEVTLLDNVIYQDLDEDDRIFLPGNSSPLTGGSKSAALDNPWVYGKSGERYGFNKDGYLLINNRALDHSIFINKPTRDFRDTSPKAGITLLETGIEAYQLVDVPSNWFETSLETAKAIYRAERGKEYNPANYDPLVLDLDGDGVELTPRTITQSGGGLRFDLDNDQFAEVTGWVNADDGLLVWDKNSNGNIDDVTELFGIGLTSGFDELKALDSNNDNRYNSADAEYSTLRVWQDKNSNGIAEEIELKTLAEADVKEILLSATQITEDNTATNNGNQIAATSVYKRFDDSQVAIADVRFELDQYNTTYIGDKSISETAALLPNAKGYGILPDLQVSMTLDTALLDVVRSVLPFLDTNDVDTLRDRAMPIFAAWGQAGVDITGEPFGGNRRNIPLLNSVGSDGFLFIKDYATQQSDGSWAWANQYRYVEDAEGNRIDKPTYQQLVSMSLASDEQISVINSEQLSFLERYFGQPMNFNSPTNESSFEVEDGISKFLQTMNERMELLAIRFAVQGGPLQKYFQDIAYDVQIDKFVPTSERQLIPTFEAIFRDAPSESVADYLESWSEFIRILIGNYDRQQEGAYNTYSFIAANLVAAYENVGLDIDFDTIASAFSIPDEMMVTTATSTNEGTYNPEIFYISQENNQQLRTYRGGNESDAYIVGQNFGQVVIEDIEDYASSAPDILRFAHLNDTNFTFYRDSLDLIITQNNTDNRVLVKRHFEGEAGHGLSQGTGIAEITFANGVYLDKLAISERTPKPAVTSDVIHGTADLNFYDSGAGYDTYVDTDEGDIYRFGLGDGHDIIKESVSYVGTNSIDYVTFKPGITKDMLRFEQEYNSNNLHIYLEGTTDVLTIIDQYDFGTTVLFDDLGYHQVEMFTFEDGTVLTALDVLHEAQRQQGDTKNNYIAGTNYHDYLDGGAGNDFLSGGESGRDIYYFGREYGFDYIYDTADPRLEYADTVVFAPNIAPEDIIVHAISSSRYLSTFDFLITIKDDTSQLRIYDQLSYELLGEDLHYIEHYQFQDAAQTRWTRDDITEKFELSYEKGETYNLIEGTSGSDRLEALPGFDKLIGWNGNDTYVYGLGDGQDIIENSQLIPDHDTLVFESGITPDNVELSLSAFNSDHLFNDLQVTFKDNNSDSLTLIDYLHPVGAKVESIQFADGTNWDIDYVHTLVASASQNDYIQGTNADNTIANSTADQYLDGYKGSDTYQFSLGDGHDVIYDEGWRDPGEDRVVFGEGITPEGTLLREDNGDLIVNFIGYSDWLTVKDQFNGFYRSIEAFVFADGTEWRVDDSQGIDDFKDIVDSKNNSNPVAKDDDGFSAAKNESVVISSAQLLANDSDSEDDAVVVMAVGEAQNGQVRLLEDGSIRFTPDNDYIGAASFRYNLHDARGGVSESAVVNLTFADSRAISNDSSVNKVEGTSGNDFINSINSQDRILGYAGNDELLGSNGDDQIWEGAGNDLTRGGFGNDILTGDDISGDSDTFVLAVGEGIDTITDFEKGIDFIGLTGNLSFGELTLIRDTQDTLLQFESDTLARIVGVSNLTESSFISV